jgi:delta-aminolevulinic acid dehydratase/porphobilinogen synthase
MSCPGQWILEWGTSKRRIKVFVPIVDNCICHVIVTGTDGFWTQKRIVDEDEFAAIIDKRIDLFTFK